MTLPRIDLAKWSHKFALRTDEAPLTPADRSRLRALRIGAVLSLSPAMMAANIVNGLITMALFRDSGHSLFLALWSAAIVLFVGVWLRQWNHGRGRPRDRASPRGTRRVVVMAAFTALLWAGPSLFLFNDATEAQRSMIAASQAGMMAGGAIALATVWQAAAAYVFIIETAALITFVHQGGAAYLSLAAMSVIFVGVMAATVRERSRGFAQMHVANRDLQEKTEVISLLLREFEANASDWLFEIDAMARLVRVSDRLAATLGEPAAELEGSSILASLGERSTHSAPFARLARAFFRRQAFRDIAMPVTIGGAERVWSLSARPLIDADGAFCGFRGVGSDVTEARRAEASIRRMANYDALTDLPNRTLLHEHLDIALDRLKKDGRGFALLSFDLDRFKHVNDTLGHGVGDHLLAEVGRRIGGNLREGDVVARFGGDEFVVLQQHVDNRATADALARRLVEILSAPYRIDGHRILIGASAGIALAPENGEDAEELLRNSDLALYRAKAEGRGAHRFFSPQMHAASLARRLMELDLREALQENALEVHFQPLFNIAKAEIAGYEALARWRHPTRGYVPPSEFIPLAEETGLIVALGAFVLRRACETAAPWPANVRVAVNLSAIQFKDGDIVRFVKETLEDVGLEPNRLELEITESILIDDKETVLRRLTELRALGVRIALDDFGTGYSSLAYLASFPFDKIKIDRAFVRDIVTRPDAAAIVGAVIALAGQLGMRTTAEGVETDEELLWLSRHGCGEAQGYLIGAPQPAPGDATLSEQIAFARLRRQAA